MNATDQSSEIMIKAISHRIRRDILRLLIADNKSYSELAELLDFNLKRESGKFNFHLKELVNAELVISEEDKYHLTEKGEELYYLLVDIERDRKIDPHGLMTALIRLEGDKEFSFFLATLTLIAVLQGMMIGIVAIAMAQPAASLMLGYGILLLTGSMIAFVIAGRYYIRTVDQLLSGNSIWSKLISSLFLLNVQWYFIRSKHRITYFIAAFSSLFGWVMAILGLLLTTADLSGIEEVGNELYLIDGLGGLFILISGLVLFRLHKAVKIDQIEDAETYENF